MSYGITFIMDKKGGGVLMYDLIIIGAGPAGVTASVYAARKRMNFLVITGDIGGQMTWSGDIENYTGYQFVTGYEMVEKFQEHMEKYKVPVKEGERIVDIKKDEVFTVNTEKGESFQSKTVIIASGKRSRELGVEGEVEFRRRGVTYCATCDGPLYSKKDVAVIGGGNSGLEAALQLMPIANHIYLIDHAPEFKGDKILQDKILSSDKVNVYHGHDVVSIYGDKVVQGIKVTGAGEEKNLKVAGIFVEVGLVPNSEFISIAEKNQWQEIIVNNRNETNIEGLYAAGDVTDVPEKQIIIAAGEGSKACLSAYNYLARL